MGFQCDIRQLELHHHFLVILLLQVHRNEFLRAHEKSYRNVLPWRTNDWYLLLWRQHLN